MKRSTYYPRHFTIQTPDGDGEATKDHQGAPWEINIPSGALRFYGSSSEAHARIREWAGEVRTGRLSFGPVTGPWGRN